MGLIDGQDGHARALSLQSFWMQKETIAVLHKGNNDLSISDKMRRRTVLLNLAYAAIMNASVTNFGTVCPDQFESIGFHLADICFAAENGGPAYSVTYAASLIPPPASQQVMVYQTGDGWKMWIAGYRWMPGGAVVTRRQEISISTADAHTISGMVTIQRLMRLSELPFYGSEDVICLDGATLSLAMSVDGKRYSAEQHSCAKKGALNETAAVFRDIAIKYEPEFSDLLDWLKP